MKIKKGYKKLKLGEIITPDCFVWIDDKRWVRTFKNCIGDKYNPSYKKHDSGIISKHLPHIKPI